MSVATNAETFDFSRGGDYPGDRGVKVTASRPGAPGYAYSTEFPDVYISDNGEVEFDGRRYPVGDMLAWMEAVRDRLTLPR